MILILTWLPIKRNTTVWDKDIRQEKYSKLLKDLLTLYSIRQYFLKMLSWLADLIFLSVIPFSCSLYSIFSSLSLSFSLLRKPFKLKCITKFLLINRVNICLILRLFFVLLKTNILAWLKWLLYLPLYPIHPTPLLTQYNTKYPCPYYDNHSLWETPLT
jgi:hypothetical protein